MMSSVIPGTIFGAPADSVINLYAVSFSRATTHNVMIGRTSPVGSIPARFFAGTMDEVRMSTQLLREAVEDFCSPATVRAAEQVDEAIERRDLVAGRAAIDRMDRELVALAGALRGLAAEATSMRVPWV